MKTTIVAGILQPSYLSWIPFFKRMYMSDVFIYLDDVQYSKNSFHNRNRIKTFKGSLTLTVPVLYKGNSSKTIADMPINNSINWQRKHFKAIEQNYKKAKYFGQITTILIEKIYSKTWERLGDLNINIIELFKNYLEINTKCYRSSEILVKGQGNEKLVNLCHRFNAKEFIVKPGTQHYHPEKFFKKNDINFKYFTIDPIPYSQLYGEFIHGLSILDYVMNCGSDNSYFQRI